jgi:hypothetical protein
VKTTYPDVDPLLWTPKEGHPKKKRRNSTDEPNAPEAILKKKTIQHKFCGVSGHNSVGCGQEKALLRASSLCV